MNSGYVGTTCKLTVCSIEVSILWTVCKEKFDCCCFVCMYNIVILQCHAMVLIICYRIL